MSLLSCFKLTEHNQDDALPETKVVKVGEFKIGLCHGHQIVPWGDPEALAMMQRQLDVDILITGHTHKNSVMEYEGNYYINPGSITGAYSGMSRYATPLYAPLTVVNTPQRCDSKFCIAIHRRTPRSDICVRASWRRNARDKIGVHKNSWLDRGPNCQRQSGASSGHGRISGIPPGLSGAIKDVCTRRGAPH